MTPEERRQRIEAHIRRDPFASQLGAVIEAIAPGYSRVSLTITETMTNFHGTAHGGIIFSLGDIAFSAAGNGAGQTAVALNISISYLRAARVGQRLIAEAREVHAGGRTGLYEITITEAGSGELVAKSQNVLYRKKEWFVPPSTGESP